MGLFVSGPVDVWLSRAAAFSTTVTCLWPSRRQRFARNTCAVAQVAKDKAFRDRMRIENNLRLQRQEHPVRTPTRLSQ